MAFPNIFTAAVSEKIISRIQALKATDVPAWGKMNATQMLAHCNVTYEMVYENKYPKPNFLVKFILKNFLKKIVTGDNPFRRNSATAPQFIIKEDRNFEREKDRLIAYVNKTQELGEAYFDNRSSISFGPLTKTEWSNMFYKHLDHHLTQFGV